MRIIETKVYKINEHPNKDKCFEWIRNNWYDLGQHYVDEIVESIEALLNIIGGSCDYCISQTPDRSEYIRFKGYDKRLLYSLSANDCPLTGVCWDIDLIKGLMDGDPEDILPVLHASVEYLYSSKGLYEMCESNEYEFDEDGDFVYAL